MCRAYTLLLVLEQLPLRYLPKEGFLPFEDAHPPLTLTELEYLLRLDQLILSSLLCVQMYDHALVLK